MPATAALGLLLVLGFAPTGLAQTPFPLPLSLENNYLVSGDYVVSGWVITPGTSDGTTTTGTITIPDPMQPVQNGVVSQVPKGADIVAAFLYWGTVESTGTLAGKQAFFRGYSITGTPLGNPMAPVSWSSGGCVGAANGSKTMQIYRADVRAFLPVDANGKIQPNAAYEVKLADTGKNTPPFPLGATLVMVYRILAPEVPLNAVVIYDGAFAPSNQSQIVTQPMIGFYQPAASPMAKLTHIVGNSQSNKLEQVTFHGQQLPDLYPTFPNVAFPGVYNNSWDNVTWNVSSFVNGSVPGFDTSETTVVTPSQSNKGCVNWGAIIFSTTVQNSDQDGLLDAWKTTAPRPGYCDAGANPGMSNQGMCRVGDVTDPSWVDLPGATLGEKDLFIQLDYMCTRVIHNADGTIICDAANGGISYAPDPQAVANVTTAFSANGHNIHLRVATDNNHVILAQTCADTFPLASPPVYCPFPGQAGVVGWKSGFGFLKYQPLNLNADGSTWTESQCEANRTACIRRFQLGARNSRHEVIFGVALGLPDWSFAGGTLTGIAIPAPGVVTFTTSTPHGLVPATSTTDTTPNARVTVSGAISNLKLNGTFLVQSVTTTRPYSFTIQNANAATAPTKSTDPRLAVASGRVGTRSGFSDIGGAESVVTLGLWGADATVAVQSSTFMHELGHANGLTHGGFERASLGNGNYSFTFEPNCKPNHQSVMNYMFQVDLLDGVLDFSDQVLPLLDESGALSSTVLASADHSSTKWYTPNQPLVGSAATRHCDGTRLAPATDPNPVMYRVGGPVNSIPWPTPSPMDINFDGKIEQCSTCSPALPPLHGYNDWANIDLRQIGATGHDFWDADDFALGGDDFALGGDDFALGGDDFALGGGVPEIDIPTASSTVPTPTGVSAALNSSNTVNVTWTPPTLFQSLITGFNIYRSKNGGPFSQLPPNPTVPVPAGTPLPLPTTFTFPDTTASCGTFTYFVTTVITDTTGITGTPGTRESVPSNTSNPVLVPCVFVGFLSPLSTASKAPAAPTFSGTRNLGNALPIKWELLDANGMPISDLSTLKSAQACPTTGATSAPGSSTIPPCVLIFSPITGGEGSTTFRFSSPTFIINWDTGSLSGLASGYWTIELQLSDGRIEWTNVLFQ